MKKFSFAILCLLFSGDWKIKADQPVHCIRETLFG